MKTQPHPHDKILENSKNNVETKNTWEKEIGHTRLHYANLIGAIY